MIIRLQMVTGKKMGVTNGNGYTLIDKIGGIIMIDIETVMNWKLENNGRNWKNIWQKYVISTNMRLRGMKKGILL